MRTLLAAASEGTFDGAAAVLHVTPSAVSQRIKALEQRVGRVLVERSKPLRLTASGHTVARFARRLALLEHDTLAELGMPVAGEPVPLPVAVNADSLATWFPAALGRVPQEAGIRFELHREDEGHSTALLREGTVMAAVTSSPDPVAGCSVRRLGVLRYRAVAAPAFVARHLPGLPDAALREVLPDAPVILFDRRDQLQDAFVHRVAGVAAGPFRHLVPSSEGFRDAVLAGLGWGMVPERQAAAPLARGALVELAPGRPADVPLYWQQWRLDSPALNAAGRAVAEEAAVALGG